MSLRKVDGSAMTKNNVTMVLGYPASGKSTITKDLVKNGFVSLNRDTEGGTIAALLPKMEALLKAGKNVALDNLFPTVEVRKPFIELAKKYNYQIDCMQMSTSIEEAQFNFLNRMIDIEGKFLTPEEIKKSKHPSIFPPAVFFNYRKVFEKPTTDEGFTSVGKWQFLRKEADYKNKALIVDYDGTLRECVNGNGKYPVEENQVEIKPNVARILQKYKKDGYILLGVSNQSGVAKGELTADKATQLFNHTNKLLGVDIEYVFCPHQSAPPMCYCRKPFSGWGVHFIRKHELSRKDTIFVGDMTTDKTFAARSGFQYVDQAEFFNK